MMSDDNLTSPDAKNILFVDDEENVLNGLRRMLHSQRHEWHMAFANSGVEALDILQRESFDIVVSDMRMPGMDGVELLEKIRLNHPETVRIILSGYADKEAALRTISSIHQFLPKPCPPDLLVSILQRAFALGSLLRDPRMKKIVSQMHTLPSLSTLYDEVVRELQSTDASLRDVADLIARDVGMSAKILHLANSAFFGFHQRVLSPQQATVLLGLDMLRILVFSIRIFQSFPKDKLGGIDLEMMWEHSVLVARMAQRIAISESADEEIVEGALLSGLFHDIGKLVFAANLPSQWRTINRVSIGMPATALDLEDKLIGATHAEVGAYLLGLWGLKENIIEAIAWHHMPERSVAAGFTPLMAVHAATMLLRALRSGDETLVRKLEDGYAAQIGLADRVPLWLQMCRQIIEKEQVHES